jgi:hypothetical protein
LESEGAEFLVLGHLLIEGIPAHKAYTNVSGYDVVATWPDTNRSARIQVKSRWATDAGAFLINKFECDFVVLVRLNRGYRYSGATKRSLPSDDPEFYVLSAADAHAITTTKGWGKIVWQKEAFEPYRRRWNLIRDFLENTPASPRRRRVAKNVDAARA